MKQTLVKHIIRVFLLVSLISVLFGCLPANKKIALPDYDRVKAPESDERGDKVSPEGHIQEVPGILLETSRLERDEEYRKTSGSGQQEAPVLEEDIPASGNTGSPEYVYGKSQFAFSLPDPAYVAYRLTDYSKRLKEWNQMAEKMVALDAGAEWPEHWHDCLQGLEYMVFGYKRVADIFALDDGRGFVEKRINPWDIVQRDVHYLESGCNDVLQQSSTSLDHFVSEYRSSNVHSLETLVQQLTLQGDYQGVISSYESSLALLREKDVGFSVYSSYAQALLRVGRVDDSVQFMGRKLQDEGVMDGSFLGNSEGIWRTVMQYADLLLIKGQVDQAKRIYLQLDDLFAAMERDSEWVAGQLHFLNDYKSSSEKYAAFVQLMREYSSYDGHGIPQPLREHYTQILTDYNDLGLSSNARRVMRKAEERARQWVQKKLTEVDYLAHEDEFQNARKILGTLTNLPDDMANEVAKMRKTVSDLEADAARVRRLLEEEELASQWEDAVSLLEAGKYEKAIEIFSFFSGSQYSQKSEKKRAEAVDKLTVGLRREAADLFVRANNMKDSSDKTNMMLRSREILLYILKMYPEAEIVPKVEQHLQALDDQIRIIDPALISGSREE